jgi:hypothetical protein
VLYTHAPPSPMLDNIVVQVPQPAKRFWYLPPEIRTLIFHEIWKTKKPFKLKLSMGSDRSQTNCGTLNCKVQYFLAEPVTNPTDVLPSQDRQLPWFLANKLICLEAIGQFQCYATWTLEYTLLDDGLKLIPDGPQITPWKNPPARKAPKGQGHLAGLNIWPFLLTPSTAQNLVLARGLGMHTFGEIDHKGRPMDRVIWYHESDLMQRLWSGVGRSAHLRSLKMTVHMIERVFTRDQDKHAPRTVFDFGWLQRLELPQLQSFQLTARLYPAFTADNNLLSEFDKAVDEVGSSMIGGCGICNWEAYFHPGVPPKKVYRFTRIEKYPKKGVAAETRN